MVLAGCAVPGAGPPQTLLILDIDEPSPLAVGSTTLLRVLNKVCPPIGVCPAASEDVLEFGVEPPGLFDVRRADTRFNITALASGTASFHVDVISHGAPTRLDYSLIANTIDTVTARPACPSHALMQAGIETTFDYQVSHASEALNGHIVPFTIVGAMLSPPDEQGGQWLQLPSASGPVTITSLYDASFEYDIDVVAPEKIDAITVPEPSSPLVVGSSIDLHADLLVGTRPVCGGSLPVTTTITTPDQCALAPGYGRNSDTIWVAGKAAGDCTVQVTVDGTSLSATTRFPVMWRGTAAASGER